MKDNDRSLQQTYLDAFHVELAAKTRITVGAEIYVDTGKDDYLKRLVAEYREAVKVRKDAEAKLTEHYNSTPP